MEDIPLILLPKLISWKTYYRRRKHELPMLVLRNAIEVLILAYNHWTRLGPVGCNIPKYRGSRFKMVFDNRAGLHQGARVPGSWHPKSGGMCRVMKLSKVPTSETELQSLLTPEYVKDHPSCLQRPSTFLNPASKNLHHLLEFTSEFYTKQFGKLVYEERIFNG